MEFSFHNLVLLFGLVVAGLSMVGAIAVGPFGWRSVRVGLAMVSVAGFLASAFWSMSYLSHLDQRRAIEARFAELRAQALAPGSPLACLERGGEGLQTACSEALFRTPETLAAANFYTASQIDVLRAANRYTGPRSQSFDDSVAALRRSLERDAFGLTAHVLTVREGCTEERCGTLALLQDNGRVKQNIRERAFDANLAHHATAWRTGVPMMAPVAAAPAGTPTTTAAAPAVPSLTPTGETRAPIPDKYNLPSSASIPPVSIMSDEPARPAAQAKGGDTKGEPKERATAERSAATAAVPAPSAASQPPDGDPQTATPHAAPAPPAAQKQQPAPRRETARPGANAPLAITPGQ